MSMELKSGACHGHGRHVVGCRVCLLEPHSGLFLPSRILATCSDTDSSPIRLTVQVEKSGEVLSNVQETQLVGGPFGVASNTIFRQGQQVFVTRRGREVGARVVRHDVEARQVLIRVGQQDDNKDHECELVSLDELRLLEQRKSLRLMSHQSGSDEEDFANGTSAIEMPVRHKRSVPIPGSRKRRPSDTLMEVDNDEDLSETSTLSECSAALLLMKLSCSPCCNDSAFGSCSASSTRSPAPSPTLSSSSFEDALRTHRVVYQCTFPGCLAQHWSVSSIEMHVRSAHLNLPASQPSEDHEEEFYYTEIDVVVNKENNVEVASKMATTSLVDHLDMARPAHEDPSRLSGGSRLSSSVPNSSLSMLGPKLIVISPKGSSGGQRGKREGKKCRKVYGVEQRELWCTQCKWKKACTRFGQSAGKTSPSSSPAATPFTLMPTSNNPAVKALKL